MSSYKGKKSDKWVVCDLCDEYCCPKCIPPDRDLSDHFYCRKCVDGSVLFNWMSSIFKTFHGSALPMHFSFKEFMVAKK